ncbi:BaiN/RdsA family NAD(P)/FAD-dependent oxidoreductase [Oceanobacter kriegii]|uniref:NAD(P)/FAD-dependent oxidoreductase n=1 Tax=Oceanobacter kriegii TaxID=64972 RepID=UPI0004028FA7|nr:TIGR03862 family flavoprotein [Oceanobacter kriegii]
MPAPTSSVSPTRIAVIGAGPAGLMAAEQIANAGLAVEVFDAMPSVARKFLLAGIGGMNITHSEGYEQFVTRYGAEQAQLKPLLDRFTPDQLRNWIHELGIETFVGTSGRVFPTDMKAAPLLRAWLTRLKQHGVVFHQRHRWTGWADCSNSQPDAQPPADCSDLTWQFETRDGSLQRQFDAVVLALGGASWKRLGSDGAWRPWLDASGINSKPLVAANCGFEVNWSDYLKKNFAGAPLKQVALSVRGPDGKTVKRTGEFIISEYGIEGSLVYALSRPIREQLMAGNDPHLCLDWLPNLSMDELQKKLSQPRGKLSFSNWLRKKLKLPAIANTLLRDCVEKFDPNNFQQLAQALKAMPIQPTSTRPVDEAISSAGGLCWDEVNEQLMLKQLPGVFVAGEMIDWEAPTGGYLLTACFATGKAAGLGVVEQSKATLG